MKCGCKNSRQDGAGRWRRGSEQCSRREAGMSRDSERPVWLQHLEKQEGRGREGIDGDREVTGVLQYVAKRLDFILFVEKPLQVVYRRVQSRRIAVAAV